MTFRGKINARGYLPSEAQFCSCRRSYFCNVNFGCHYQEMVIFYIEVKFYFFDMNEEKKGAADELRQHETVCVGLEKCKWREPTLFRSVSTHASGPVYLFPDLPPHCRRQRSIAAT